MKNGIELLKKFFIKGSQASIRELIQGSDSETFFYREGDLTFHRVVGQPQGKVSTFNITISRNDNILWQMSCSIRAASDSAWLFFLKVIKARSRRSYWFPGDRPQEFIQRKTGLVYRCLLLPKKRSFESFEGEEEILDRDGKMLWLSTYKGGLVRTKPPK